MYLLTQGFFFQELGARGRARVVLGVSRPLELFLRFNSLSRTSAASPMTTASSKTSESALDSADTGSNVGSELDGACFGEDAAGHDTWVMCDTCSKWRRVYSADSIDTEAFFACSMLIGWSCNQPEVEYVGAAGTASAVESDNLNGDNRRKKGWRGSAKRSIRLGPTDSNAS